MFLCCNIAHKYHTSTSWYCQVDENSTVFITSFEVLCYQNLKIRNAPALHKGSRITQHENGTCRWKSKIQENRWSSRKIKLLYFQNKTGNELIKFDVRLNPFVHKRKFDMFALSAIRINAHDNFRTCSLYRKNLYLYTKNMRFTRVCLCHCVSAVHISKATFQ